VLWTPEGEPGQTRTQTRMRGEVLIVAVEKNPKRRPLGWYTRHRNETSKSSSWRENEAGRLRRISHAGACRAAIQPQPRFPGSGNIRIGNGETRRGKRCKTKIWSSCGCTLLRDNYCTLVVDLHLPTLTLKKFCPSERTNEVFRHSTLRLPRAAFTPIAHPFNVIFRAC
jgi:hypothetical protein